MKQSNSISGKQYGDIYLYRPTPEYRVTNNPMPSNPEAAATAVPNSSYYIPSVKYSLKANGIEIPVVQYNRMDSNMDVARFASNDDSPEFTVIADTNITGLRIHPEMYYPEGSYKIEGNTLTFKMAPELRYTVLEINGSAPGLAIINDPQENSSEIPDKTASNVLNIMNFVTDNTGAMDQTQNFKLAVETLYASPQYDTLYIPDGYYLYAGFEIRGTPENKKKKPITIYTEEGALLQTRMQNKKGPVMEPAIGIWYAENITFLGRGIFDGNGCENFKTWRKDAKDSNHQGGVMVVHSNNIKFKDTYIRDSKQWNWETHTSKNCTFINIKGLSPYNHSWVDGINFASGQNLTLDGALTLGNDDIFASGHYNPDDGYKIGNTHFPENTEWDTEDSFRITLKNHLGWSFDAGNGLRIGHAAGYKLTDYTFINCHGINFRAGHKGIRVHNLDRGTGLYPYYEGIILENCSYDTSRINGENIYVAGFNGENKIKNVKLLNCRFSHEKVCRLENIGHLEIKNLHMAGEKIHQMDDLTISFIDITDFDSDF